MSIVLRPAALGSAAKAERSFPRHSGPRASVAMTPSLCAVRRAPIPVDAESSMRILFVGGMYRGYRLAPVRSSTSAARTSSVHSSTRKIRTSLPSSSSRSCPCSALRACVVQGNGKIAESQLADVTNRLQPDVIFCLGWRTLIPPGILAAAARGHCRSRFPAAAAAALPRPIGP